jgi:hypothetical protein
VADDLAVGGQRQRHQPADHGEGQDAEQHLPDPAPAERRGHRPHDAAAGPGQAEQRGHQQPEEQGGDRRRPERGGERLGAVQLRRGEPGGGVDRAAAAGRLRQGRPGRGDRDDHDERDAENDRADQRGPASGHPADPRRAGPAARDDEGR